MGDALQSAAEKAPARLDLEGVSVAYEGRPPVLIDLSFQVAQGVRVAVVGPNGAGKSTLFKALVHLLPISSGRILIHGLPLGAHQDCVAYVPQREEVDWRFPATALDVTLMGRYARLGWCRRPRREDREVAAQCLEAMGIAHMALQPIGQLSGGQQQRVFLARALAQQPHILLMDEPFTGVDAATQEVTLDLLDQLRAQQVTVMVSTHDLKLAGSRFDQVLLLNHRLIGFGPPNETLTAAKLSEMFGGNMYFLNGAMVFDHACCSGRDRHDGGAQ